MTQNGYQAGTDCLGYYNSATYITPTWVEIGDLGDLSLPAEWGEAEVKRRGVADVEVLPTKVTRSADFTLVRKKGDAVLVALRAAFTGKTATEFAFMDGAIATSGNKGLRMTCIIVKFSEGEGLEDTVTIDVTVKPTPNADAQPAEYTVP